MAKLAAAPDLGSGGESRVGSSPTVRTNRLSKIFNAKDAFDKSARVRCMHCMAVLYVEDCFVTY